MTPEEAAAGHADERGLVPSGLTVGDDKVLYTTDAEHGALYRHAAGEATLMAKGWHRPYGIATLPDGHICVGRYDSEDPLFRRTEVVCQVESGWHPEVSGLGSGVNGLAVSGEGLWVATWEDTMVESRDGRLLLVSGGQVTRNVFIPERFPQFIAVLPNGELIVSVWREDASGFTGGEVLRVTMDGEVLPFSDDLEQPSGVAVDKGKVWVADYLTGDVVSLSLEGDLLGRREEGLRGPLGMAVRQGQLCVAESLRGRVICLE